MRADAELSAPHPLDRQFAPRERRLDREADVVPPRLVRQGTIGVIGARLLVAVEEKGPAAVDPRLLEALQRRDGDDQPALHVYASGPGRRLAVRQADAAPLVAELERWMRAERERISRHAPVAKAINYMLSRWPSFTRFLEDGRICLTNNAAERALRGAATLRSLCTPLSSVCKH